MLFIIWQVPDEDMKVYEPGAEIVLGQTITANHGGGYEFRAMSYDLMVTNATVRSGSGSREIQRTSSSRFDLGDLVLTSAHSHPRRHSPGTPKIRAVGKIET